MLSRLKYQIRDPDYLIEELLLAGMISHTAVLKKIAPRFEFDYLELDDSRTVAKWVMDYYSSHGKAPKDKISVIHRLETRKDEPAVRERLKSFVSALLNREGETSNTEYVVPKALKFFRKRALTISLEDTNYYLGKGDLNKAEATYFKYKQVAQGLATHINPLSSEALNDWWNHSDQELIRFPGALGDYLAPICRGQLIGILGPPKRGKTTMLLEFAIMGIMHRLNVAFFSLELSARKMNEKIDTRITGTPKLVIPTDIVLPVVDCLYNQTGECHLSQRLGQSDLMDSEGNIASYNKRYDMVHKPCSECLKSGSTKINFKYAPWFETVQYPKTSLFEFKRTKDEFKAIFGENNFVLESYPVGTFGPDDLENRLDILEQETGFIPDIVVIDYADIMKKVGSKDFRHQVGDIWERLIAIAQLRNCLVVSGSQANRAAADKPDLTIQDLAEDFSKAMISDAFLAINQTSSEKDNMIARVSVILHRHRKFSLKEQCRILQGYDVGQFSLDSHIIKRKMKRKRG